MPNYSYVIADTQIDAKIEVPKVRTDLSVSIFEQLTLPLRDAETGGCEQKLTLQQDTDTIVNSSESASEILVIYILYHNDREYTTILFFLENILQSEHRKFTIFKSRGCLNRFVFIFAIN